MSLHVVPAQARKYHTVYDVLDVLGKHLGVEPERLRDNSQERSPAVTLILNWLNNYADSDLSTGEFKFFVTWIEAHVPGRCPDLDLGQYRKLLFPSPISTPTLTLLA